MYYLGIDGGGTKTAFEIIDERGNILSSVKTSTCSYLQIGKENFGKVIREGAEAICKRLGVSLPDISYTCIGIPSFGEIISDDPDLIHITKKILGSNVKCVNDVVVAWAGSLGCEPGINLLAGTGSMGYGVDQKGNYARSGGWGHYGGDEGSAHWLGKKLIELFTKQADGRLQKGATYDIVRDQFGLTYDFEFISILYDQLKCKRDEVAKLQLLLNKAADQGDCCAIDLYRQAAYELSLIVVAIINALDFEKDRPITVSYSGGVFKAGNFVFSPLIDDLRDYNIELREPLLTPATGAALYAFLNAGGKKSEEIVENLRRQEHVAFA